MRALALALGAALALSSVEARPNLIASGSEPIGAGGLVIRVEEKKKKENRETKKTAKSDKKGLRRDPGKTKSTRRQRVEKTVQRSTGPVAGREAAATKSPSPSSSGGSSTSVAKAGGLATVRIRNKCRERAVVKVRYKPGTADEVTRDITVNAGSTRSLGAYVQTAEGTYELRSKRKGSLRSSTRGGEIVLDTC
jgi:hypothetical protein